MRKNLLFFLMAMLMPCLAWADNMAIEKTHAASYGSYNVTENRLAIPAEACGFSSPMDGSENYTIAAWVKPTDVMNNGVILSLSPQVHYNTNGNWALLSTTSGALSLNGHGGDTDHGAGTVGITGNTNAKINIGEWNYVAVVVDNANLTFSIYVNGELGDSKTMSGQMYFPESLHSGDDGPAWFHVAGYGVSALMDEVHGFNKALSAEEVANAYKGNLTSINGLTGYYTLDEQAVEGHFANLAANAADGSDAIFNKWAGVYMWGSWINGSNTPTLATLVPGREIAPAEVKYTFAVPTAEQLGLSEIMFLTENDEMLEGGQSYELVEGTEISFMATSSAAYIIAGVTVNGVAAEIQEQGDGSMVYGRFVINSNIDSDAIVFDLQKKEEEKPSITYRRKYTDGSSRYYSEISYTVGEESKVLYSTTSPTEESYYVKPAQNQWQEEGAYIDFTDKVLEVPVNAGNFTVTLKGISGTAINWSQNCVFVDWNNNGEFTDEGETNGVINRDVKPNQAGGGLVVTATGENDVIALPEGIQPGTYTMLIVLNEPKGTDGSGDLWGTSWEWSTEIFADGVCSIINGQAYALTVKVTEAAAATATLTIEQPENGTLTVKNGEETLATGAEVEIGTELTVAAEPAEGYQLVAVKVNGTAIEGNTFSMTEEGATVSAEFEAVAPALTYRRKYTDGSSRYYSEISYTVGQKSKVLYSTTSPTEESYYVKPAQNQWQEEGAYIDFTDKVLEVPVNAGDFTVTLKGISGTAINWSQNCVFVDWNHNGQFTDEGETNGVINRDVKPNQPGGGLVVTATGENDVIALPEGIQPGTYTMLIVLNEPKGTDGSGDLWGTSWEWSTEIFADGVCSIINGQAYALTVKVTEAAEGSTVNVAVAEGQGTMGTVSIEGAEGSSIVTNQEITIVAQPNTTLDAAFLNWTKDGEVVSTDARYTFTPDADATYVANFGWTVNYRVSGDGSIEVLDGDKEFVSGNAVAPGTVLTIKVTPDEGKYLVDLIANGQSVTVNKNTASYTVNGYTEISAMFEDLPTYTYTYTVAGGRGSLEAYDDFDEDYLKPVEGSEPYENNASLTDGQKLYLLFTGEKIEGTKYEQVTAVEVNHAGSSILTTDNFKSKTFSIGKGRRYMAINAIEGDVNVNVTFSDELAGIADILFDGIEGETEYFDLNGVRVDAENVQNGIYILRRGNVTKKVYIQK